MTMWSYFFTAAAARADTAGVTPVVPLAGTGFEADTPLEKQPDSSTVDRRSTSRAFFILASYSNLIDFTEKNSYSVSWPISYVQSSHIRE
ncbi:hypothetical protein D3C75_1173300 [compost metagenome]